MCRLLRSLSRLSTYWSGLLDVSQFDRLLANQARCWRPSQAVGSSKRVMSGRATWHDSRGRKATFSYMWLICGIKESKTASPCSRVNDFHAANCVARTPMAPHCRVSQIKLHDCSSSGSARRKSSMIPIKWRSTWPCPSPAHRRRGTLRA
jgi:hypothetical protein